MITACAAQCIHQALKKATVKLLEPVMELEVWLNMYLIIARFIPYSINWLQK